MTYTIHVNVFQVMKIIIVMYKIIQFFLQKRSIHGIIIVMLDNILITVIIILKKPKHITPPNKKITNK